MASSDDRPLPGEGAPSPADDLADRVASLRASIAERLGEVAVDAHRQELEEHTKALARIEDSARQRLNMLLSEHLEAAETRFESMMRDLADDLAARARASNEEARGELETLGRHVLAETRERAGAEFSALTAEAVQNLRARNEVTRLATLEDLSRKHAEITRKAREELEARQEKGAAAAQAAAEALETRLTAYAGAGLSEARELLAQQADADRTALSEAIEAKLAEALERVRAEGTEQLERDRADFRDEVQVLRRELEAITTKLHPRKQRQELRLAKAETSRRIRGALGKLESERAEIDAAASEIRSATGEAGEGLAEALRRVEATVAEIEESRGRIADLERRAGVAEREAARSAEMARNAVVLEARMREALSMEAAAAEQIAVAERRLIDLVVNR